MRGFFSFLTAIIFCSFFIPESTQAFQITETGQVLCYGERDVIECPEKGSAFYGQDAHYIGIARSYTKLDEKGVALAPSSSRWVAVKDNITGLVWEVKKRDGTIYDMNRLFTLEEAKKEFVATLNQSRFAGFSDWRIPTVKELSSLVLRDRYGPAIDTRFFPHTAGNYYWTSTPGNEELPGYWLVLFLNGNITREYRSQLYRARAVRGEQGGSILTDNGDGTVTDSYTGLMWQKVPAGLMTWKEALAYCEDLDLAGHVDWKLPDINELISIVDYTIRIPSIDSRLFPDTLASYYWSSTSYVYNPDAAWMTNFLAGDVNDNKKTYRYPVRAVRRRKN